MKADILGGTIEADLLPVNAPERGYGLLLCYPVHTTGIWEAEAPDNTTPYP